MLGGWIGVRVALLWPPTGPLSAALPLAVPHAVAARLAPLVPRPHVTGPRVTGPRMTRYAGALAPDAPRRAILPPSPVPAVSPPIASAPAAPPRAAMAPLAEIRMDAIATLPGQFTDPLPPPPKAGIARWSGSGWAVLRGGRGIGGLNGGQLGGAQAGVRVAYALTRHWSAVGRIAAPLGATGTEASLGLEWRPGALPLRLVAERRVLLDSGRQGTAIGMVGGIGPAPIARGVTLEGYGQAGAIRRESVAAFVDGAVKLSHALGALELGVGAWGGAQPGVARLDLGPSLGTAIPVARHRLRLALDWRQRVAGRARPGSGLALTLGADF